VPLPKPLVEVQRGQLAEIWRFATANFRWPAADELHASPADQPLGALSPEFVHLIEGREPFAPYRLELGLTVAGVAACDPDHPVLAAFLDFLAVRFAVWEREYLPEKKRPDPDEIILKHILEARKEYRPSFTALMEHVGYPPEPSPALDDGLDLFGLKLHDWRTRQPVRASKLLMLLITVETAGWAVFDGGSVRLLDQRFFRPFAGVTGLDDYWERRFKPWTHPSLAEAMHQQVTARPDTYNRARLLKAQPSLLDDLLLDSIYAEAEGRAKAFVLCPPLAYEIDTAAILKALERLEKRDLVRRPTLDLGPDLPAVALTDTGAKRVHTSRQTWDNLAARSRLARDALLAWLYDQQDHPQYFAHLQRFLGDARSLVDGQFFSLSDVDGAASYLLEKQLIRGTVIDQTNAPGTARITSAGIDCIENGGSVADHLQKRPPAGPTGYTFNAPITATNFAAGDHAQQVASSHGMSGSELRGLMQAIIEALPGLELQPAYAGEVVTIAGEVITETDNDARDPAKLRRTLERLRALLAMSGKTALAAALTALIDAIFTKLGLPPGAGG
jgi:hypothetical protein